jgi:putative ATP-dependent endonuclease of OLD family
MNKDVGTDLNKLNIEDFHHKDTSKPIKITATFVDLSEAAKAQLKDYVRLDKLIVSAVAEFDANTQRAEVKQFGSRLGFEEFRRFFEQEKNGAKVPELQTTFKELRSKFTEIENALTKTAMIEALRNYEAKNEAK